MSAHNNLNVDGKPTNLSPSNLDRIVDILTFAWAELTREDGSGLLVYHVLCDTKGIHDDQRAPALPILLQLFITTMRVHTLDPQY